MSRWRRSPLAALPFVVVLALVAAGCGGGEDSADDNPADGNPTDGAAALDDPGTSAAVDGTSDDAAAAGPGADLGDGPTGCDDLSDPGPWSVGRRTFTVVDPARPTAARASTGAPEQPDRTLEVTVLHPSAADPADPDAEAGTFTDGAPVADGDFPLVVYSHGMDSGGDERNDDLAAWAAAGHVVVAPTFPLSSGPQGSVADLPNQPADVTFLLDAIAGGAEGVPTDLLEAVRADCVALAGHSLGGATTLAAAYDPCCAPEQVRAVVGIAGFLWGPTAGHDWTESPDTPLLLVHGDTDIAMPAGRSAEAATQLGVPGWFLRFPAGGHNSMFEAPEDEVSIPVVVAFLAENLRGEAGAVESVAAGLAGRDDVSLTPLGG